MVEEICEICGYKSLLGAVEKCCAIPTEITEAAGTPESQTLKMCCNCRRELETWYSAKVAKMVYDNRKQQYRHRTSAEMVEEYQSVFNGFVAFKKRPKVKRASI